MGEKAKEALWGYLEFGRNELLKRQKEEPPDQIRTDVLFLNRYGKPFSRQGIWLLLKGYGRRAGLEKELTPCLLRNSCAVHMLENGADAFAVGEILGCAEASVNRYRRESRRGKIKDVYKSCHPRA